MPTLSDTIRDKLKPFVFRRVSRVSHFPLSQIRYYTKPNVYTKVANVSTFSKQEFDQNLECRYHNYYGWSSKVSLRENDAFPEHSIFFEKNSFGRFDPILLQIDPDSTNQRDVPPREGDLICGIVKRNSQNNLHYSQWFICSEQFYRAWTLLMYDSHSSFQKAEKKKCGAKSYWMSGNRLMTNNYLKWMLGSEKQEIIPSEEEQSRRYWHLRCETPARTWIHVYCALVLIVRYGELPSESNVPVIRGPETRPYPHWHLPLQFVQLFRDAHQ